MLKKYQLKDTNMPSVVRFSNKKNDIDDRYLLTGNVFVNEDRVLVEYKRLDADLGESGTA